MQVSKGVSGVPRMMAAEVLYSTISEAHCKALIRWWTHRYLCELLERKNNSEEHSAFLIWWASSSSSNCRGLWRTTFCCSLIMLRLWIILIGLTVTVRFII